MLESGLIELGEGLNQARSREFKKIFLFFDLFDFKHGNKHNAHIELVYLIHETTIAFERLIFSLNSPRFKQSIIITVKNK